MNTPRVNALICASFRICSSASRPRAAYLAQRGFTLVELMIAVLIGLFLTGGLLTLTSAMKRTGNLEGALGQLHDTQRLTFSLMADVIQSSGFYTNPVGANNPAAAFPAAGVFGTAGQAVFGTDAGIASAPRDTVTVRYNSGGGDGVLNCIGGTSAAAAAWIANFQVDGLGNLSCVLTTNGTAGPAVVVATGVQYLSVVYGVQTNANSGTYSIDTYLTATQVTAGNYWPNVISVQVTLMFVNPIYCAGGAGCQAGQLSTVPQYITLTRTIALMNKAGVNT